MRYFNHKETNPIIRKITKNRKSLDDYYDLMATRWAIKAERQMKRQRKISMRHSQSTI